MFYLYIKKWALMQLEQHSESEVADSRFGQFSYKNMIVEGLITSHC